MMGLCILHYGMHKTGSSSIQESLFHHLSDDRFHYVNLGAPNASGKIATAFMRDPASYHAHKKRGTASERLVTLRKQIRERLEHEMERCGERTAILSGEDISQLDETELRALKETITSHGKAIRAVGYIRSPRSFMESAFQQRVKGRLNQLKVDSLYPNYRATVGGLERVFGMDNVEYWHFNTDVFPGGCVVQDFCQRIGITFDAKNVVRANTALPRSGVAFLYAYRKFGPNNGRGPAVIRLDRLLADRLRMLIGPRFRFHSSLIESVLASHAEDIAWMEERLGTSLAEPPVPDEPLSVRSEADLLSFSEDALRWLAEQVGESYRSIQADMGPREVAAWVHRLRLRLSENDASADKNSRPVTDGPPGRNTPPSEVRARYRSLDLLCEQGLPDGRFTVNVAGTEIDCLFSAKDTDWLFVVLSGARLPSKTPLPVFQRWSWHGLFPGSVLYISDPTLNLSPARMHVGWYIGSQEKDLTGDLATLVTSIAQLKGVPTGNIVVYGSSGGGFAAIKLAARLGDATAVAINPQVNALEYIPEMVEELLSSGFNGRAAEQLSPQERARFDALHALAQAPRMKCLYAQNIRDVAHYRKHFSRFCRSTGAPMTGGRSPDGRMVTLVFEDASAHGAEPKTLAPKIISAAVALAQGGAARRQVNGCRTAPPEGAVNVFDLSMVLARLRAQSPGLFSGLSDERARALVNGAFAKVHQSLFTAGEGIFPIPGLGHFRIRAARDTKERGATVQKNLMFFPEQRLGKGQRRTPHSVAGES